MARQNHSSIFSLPLEVGGSADALASNTTLTTLAATPQRPPSFLDLPIEVRQQIYTYVLPTMRIINFPCSYQQEQTLLTTSTACPSLFTEIWDWIYKHCRARLTVVPDKEVDLPNGVNWARFSKVDIVIEHPHQPPTPSGEYEWSGMKQAVASLQSSVGNVSNASSVLPELRINFAERCAQWTPKGDPVWTKTVWSEPIIDNTVDSDDQEWCEVAQNTFLRTPSGDPKKPLVIGILDCFLDLPPCERALVRPLSNVERDPDLEGYHLEKSEFEEKYMWDVFDALMFWMGGRRSSELSEQLSACGGGETRLERLAYATCAEYGGEQYWRGGRSECEIEGREGRADLVW